MKNKIVYHLRGVAVHIRGLVINILKALYRGARYLLKKYLLLWRKWPKDMAYITVIIILILINLARPVLAAPEFNNHALGEKPKTDLTVKVIDEYLKNTPMAGTGKIAAETAEKYQLPRYLMVAIAGHESSFGRLGYAVGRHNAWGLGIHQGWDWPNWEQAYDKLGYTLRHYYFDEGRNSPETIEDKWAPPGENSAGYEWSAGVNKYGAELLALEEVMNGR